MLFRRVENHVKTKIWLAVLIDFSIVVMGVFVGLHIWNWSEKHSAHSDYEQALKRLDAEIQINRVTVAQVDTKAAQSLQIVGDGLDILLSCLDSTSNRSLVNKGLNELRSTHGIYLRSHALKELTTNTRFLAQQTPQERQRFSEMLFYFDLTRVDSDFVEDHPLTKRFEDNPLLSVGPRLSVSEVVYGVEIPHIRSIELNAPIDVACKNDPLIKAFVTWERWQGDLLPMMGQITKELNATAALLAKHK